MGNAKLHSPQEVEVHYILPALRKALAVELKNKGMSQKEIAKLLHVTEPAVSQYTKGKRAGTLAFSEEVQTAISEAATAQLNVMRTTQKLLKVIKNERVTCGVCKTVTLAPSDCEVCFK